MTLLLPLRAAVRSRHLASDERAGIWSRAKTRRTQREFIRKHWLRLSSAGLAGIALSGAAAIIAPGTFYRGALFGAGSASIVGYLWLWVVQSTGTAPAMMGDLAEQWTASELRSLRRHGWRVINHVSLGIPDIDHVLIGPGGAFAIETKWSATPSMDTIDPWIQRGVRQVQDAARQLRLWHGFKAAGISEVAPVVILWGANSDRFPRQPTKVGEALVVPGSALEDWLDSLNGNELSETEVDAAYLAIDKHLRKRDAHDHEVNPLQPSAALLLTRGGLTAVGVGLSLLASSALLRLTGSVWWWALTCSALIGLAVPALRWKAIRYPVMAWQTGLGFVLSLTAVCAGVQALG